MIINVRIVSYGDERKEILYVLVYLYIFLYKEIHAFSYYYYQEGYLTYFGMTESYIKMISFPSVSSPFNEGNNTRVWKITQSFLFLLPAPQGKISDNLIVVR